MKLLKSLLLIYAIQILSISNGYAQPENNPAVISMPGPQLGVAWGFTYGYDIKPGIFLPRLRKMGVNLTKLVIF